MRVLVIGAGYVTGLMLPYLKTRHDVRTFDVKPIADIEGDATDPEALARAMSGMDGVVHCAMGPEEVNGSFDVNVKSVYVTLRAAYEAGITHAVHISSMSVYRDLIEREIDESVPPDANDLYGLTKRLGEHVCEAAAQEWGMSVNILRLAWPTSDDVWPGWKPPWREGPPALFQTSSGTPIGALRASDLAEAVHAALGFRDGKQVFTITGDTTARLWSTAKAARLLGWHATGV